MSYRRFSFSVILVYLLIKRGQSWSAFVLNTNISSYELCYKQSVWNRCHAHYKILNRITYSIFWINEVFTKITQAT